MDRVEGDVVRILDGLKRINREVRGMWHRRRERMASLETGEWPAEKGEDSVEQ